MQKPSFRDLNRTTKYGVVGAAILALVVSGVAITSGSETASVPAVKAAPFGSAPLTPDEEDVLGAVAAASARHRANPDQRIPLAGDDPEAVQKEPFVAGQLLVSFKPSATQAARRAAVDEVGGRILRGTHLADTELVDLGVQKDVEKAQGILEKLRAVDYAEPNHIYSATVRFPSDKFFSNQWAFNNTGQTVGSSIGTSDADIDAPEAWDTSTGGEVTVAVIDSGVAFDHPDLSTNLWNNAGESGTKATNGIDDDGNGFIDDNVGWDFVQNDNRPLDQNGHGTHVAGTIGAQGNNSIGVAGAAWDVRLMSLRALGPQGAGTTAEITAAVRYAVANGADVVNLSLGGPSSSQTLAQAIANAPQTLFVVAAGNEGANNDTTASYPCNYTSANIICVAATTQTDALASFSNYGATRVDLGAPGTQIVSTVPAFTRPFTDGFDSLAKWTTNGSPLWGIGTENGRTFAADSPGAPYMNGVNSSIQSAQPINLQGSRDCRLTYSLRLAAQSPTDGLEVEASSDGSTWEQVSAWTGSTGGEWLPMSDDLRHFSDSSSLYLRFRFVSGSTASLAGADVDDLSVACLATNISGDNVGYASGTSMATPVVSGAAAVLFAADPSASVSEVMSALLTGADKKATLTGKTVTGARLNLAGALSVLTGSPASLPSPSSSSVAPAAVSPTPSAPPVSSPTAQQPQPQPTTSAPPAASPSPSSEPKPAEPSSPPQNSPEPTPSSEPQPEPEPEPEPESAAVRSVTLQLRKHLKARGTVRSADADCFRGTTVVIRRNGGAVKKATTLADGTYAVRLADRPGRYEVKVAPTDEAGTTCTGATSPVRRHLH